MNISYIIQNGGATIDRNGKAVNFKTGYQVSYQDLMIVPVEELTEMLLVEVISKLHHGDYCGVWIDSGKAYVDISRRVKTKREAIKVGKSLCQLSILCWSDMSLFWL